MSKIINAIQSATITITNIFGKENVVTSDVALDLLGGAKGLWNKGLASLVEGATAVVDAGDLFSRGMGHDAAIRLFGSNSCVILAPGDQFTFTTKTSQETLYYARLNSELVAITAVDAEGNPIDLIKIAEAAVEPTADATEGDDVEPTDPAGTEPTDEGTDPEPADAE